LRLLRLLLLAPRTAPASATVPSAVSAILKSAVATVGAITTITTITTIRSIAAIGTVTSVAGRHVLRLLITARWIATVRRSCVVPDRGRREAGTIAGAAGAVHLATAPIVARPALARCRRSARWLGVGCSDAFGTFGTFGAWYRRRRWRCRIRIVVAARRDAGLGTGRATSVIAIRIVAGVRVGLVGRASATAATRWASTFSHAFVG